MSDPKDFVSTGNLALDTITDGGIPFGYAVEFLGLSQSGKSTFIQKIMGNAQQKYEAVCALLDREKAFTPSRAQQLGIDTENIIVVHPEDIPTITDGFQFLIDLITDIRSKDKNTYIVCGIDSLASFGKDVNLEKSDSGRKAKAAHEGMRELLSYLDDRVMVLVANQVTYKIGVLYGDPKTSTAGESMKYYCNMRIALEDRHKIVDPVSEDVLGNWIGVETIKTRLGPCYRTVYIPHFYKEGISYYGGYARLLVDRGYCSPKNKAEFEKFKQKTVIYINGEDKEQFNEFEVEKFIEKHPELVFNTYPEFNRSGKKIKEEEEDE